MSLKYKQNVRASLPLLLHLLLHFPSSGDGFKLTLHHPSSYLLNARRRRFTWPLSSKLGYYNICPAMNLVRKTYKPCWRLCPACHLKMFGTRIWTSLQGTHETRMTEALKRVQRCQDLPVEKTQSFLVLRSATLKSDISLDYCGRTMTMPHNSLHVSCSPLLWIKLLAVAMAIQ